MKPASAILIAILLLWSPTALQSQACDPAIIEVPTPTAQAFSLVLVGGAELQDAASELYAVEAQVSADTRIFSGPGSSFAEMGSLSAGETVQVQACNCTQHWLRIVLDGGQAGWIFSNDVTFLGDVNTLPEANFSTPVYTSMQAFRLQSGARACGEAAEEGVLIQTTAAAPVPLQVNGVAMVVSGTVFAQSSSGEALTIEVLSGSASVTVGSFTAAVHDGMRAAIVPGGAGLATGEGQIQVEPYQFADVESLPVEALPEAVEVADALANDAPQVVGLEPCRVISNSTRTACRLHFANRDGDAITRIDVEFVSAPQGEWTSSSHDNPTIVQGDPVSGVLAWAPTCSLGAPCFIGPVFWSITLTDAAGNVSEPFLASFNCVDA
jgi:hypothetical protein